MTGIGGIKLCVDDVLKNVKNSIGESPDIKRLSFFSKCLLIIPPDIHIVTRNRSFWNRLESKDKKIRSIVITHCPNEEINNVGNIENFLFIHLLPPSLKYYFTSIYNNS